MQVYVVTGHNEDFQSLRALIARLESWGVAGFLSGDHLFVSLDGRRDASYRPPEAFTLLSAVGAISDRLVLGTIVANVGFAHPAVVLRHFAQLATLYGGDRVLAGIGAGWNVEEFDAIGIEMPPHKERTDRLEAAAALARQWFDGGLATIKTASFEARELPMAPAPVTAPRLMLGGGSTRLLQIAGRYADHIDLNGSARKPLGSSANIHEDSARRALATIDDLEQRVQVLEAAERDAGRPPGVVTRSIVVDHLEIVDESEVADAEQRFCAARKIPLRPLADNPYVLIGDPARIRDLLAERAERLGLSFVITPDGDSLGRFMDEIAPAV